MMKSIRDARVGTVGRPVNVTAHPQRQQDEKGCGDVCGQNEDVWRETRGGYGEEEGELTRDERTEIDVGANYVLAVALASASTRWGSSQFPN